MTGEDLKEWRERNSLTQTQAAKVLGVDLASYMNLEAVVDELVDNPSMRTVEKLTRAYDNNPAFIMDEIYDLNVSAEFVKSWRKRMGWDQDQAAKALGVGKSTLAKHEISKGEVPRTLVLACIGIEALYKKDISI